MKIFNKTKKKQESYVYNYPPLSLHNFLDSMAMFIQLINKNKQNKNIYKHNLMKNI